jgi:hypothetical protein
LVGSFEVLQNIFFAAVVIPWIGVGIALYFRYRSKQRNYLKRFPPVEGISLDTYFPSDPRRVLQAINRAMRQRQDDPELERMRREMWRSYRTIVVWVFGFPLVAFGLGTGDLDRPRAFPLR